MHPITPFAQRLAENAGVAWWTLGSSGSEITERDVLEHLTDVVTGATRTELNGGAEAEIDLSDLAASLAGALEDLLAGPTDAATPVAAIPVAAIPVAATPLELTSGVPARRNADFGTYEVSGAEPSGVIANVSNAAEFDKAAQSTPTEAEHTSPELVEHVQAQLGAERRAHTETKVHLGKLEATLKQQQVRAAQLKPLASEIRRLGSALGVANAEMERLRPFETLVGTLQNQLEQALSDEARVRLLCRDLQEQLDSDLLAAQQRPRWFFRRRSP